MFDKRLREQIAFEAARLLHEGQESEYVRAKRKAARSLGVRFTHADLPSTREIRSQLRKISELRGSEELLVDPRRARVEALWIMRQFRAFRPLLLEPDLMDEDGNRPISDLEIRVHADDPAAVLEILASGRLGSKIDSDHFTEENAAFLRVLLPLAGAISCRLTIHWGQEVGLTNGSHISMPVRTLSIEQLQRQLAEELPEMDLEEELEGLEPGTDRFRVYRILLDRLEEVRQDPKYHPEGDVLYHSLQVFDLMKTTNPYDEELLTAALLHDVGKGEESQDHVKAGLDALRGTVTHRTRWLIGHHEQALAYRSRELSVAERHQLEESEDFEDLLLLAELDEAGRSSGVETSSVKVAIEYLRSLADGNYGLFGKNDPLPFE